MRLYLIPVRDACNSNCTFCYMKEKRHQPSNKPQFIEIGSLEKAIKDLTFEEVEITGGGEPLLHPQINEIINLFPDKYVKMYTNGFLLKTIHVNELNISRVHYDSKVNNLFYRSKNQNELEEVIDFYRTKADKIRLQIILLKGAIENEKQALEFIRMFENKVDVFMFRTLFTRYPFEKDRFVKYFTIKHPKAKIDTTLDNYDRELYFIGTDSRVHISFQY